IRSLPFAVQHSFFKGLVSEATSRASLGSQATSTARFPERVRKQEPSSPRYQARDFFPLPPRTEIDLPSLPPAPLYPPCPLNGGPSSTENATPRSGTQAYLRLWRPPPHPQPPSSIRRGERDPARENK